MRTAAGRVVDGLARVLRDHADLRVAHGVARREALGEEPQPRLAVVAVAECDDVHALVEERERALRALIAAFPEGSKAGKLPCVLLKVEGRGNCYEEHETFPGGSSRWTGSVALSSVRVCRIMTDAFRESSADKVLLPDFTLPRRPPPLPP